MAVYNVLVPVVELVEAETPEEAVAKLRRSLDRAGYEPFVDEGSHPVSVFESEELSPEVLAMVLR